ncbi:MAG: DUF4145 domain-containing protein [Pleomorphochaeta sp.]
MNIVNQELITYLNRESPLDSFTCPHCSTYSKLSETDLNKISFKINKNIKGFSLSIHCPKCKKTSIYFIMANEEQIRSPNFYNFEITKIISLKQIYPKEKSIAKTFPEFVPEQLISLYDEMCDLLTINPKAAIVWARKWIEKFIITKWPEYNNSKPLAQKIDALSDSNKIDDKDVLDAIRKIGNDSVHIQSIEEDIEISQDDAILGIRLIEDLITEHYVVPAERKQRRASFKALIDQKQIEAKALKQK